MKVATIIIIFVVFTKSLHNFPNSLHNVPKSLHNLHHIPA